MADIWLKLPVMGEIPTNYDYAENSLNSLDVSLLVGIVSQLADNPHFITGKEKIAGGSIYFPHLRDKLQGVLDMVTQDTTIEAAKQLAGDCGCSGSSASSWPNAEIETVATPENELQACKVATKIIDISIEIVGAIVSIHSAWVGAFNPNNYVLLLVSAVVAILGITLGGVVIPAIALIGAVTVMLQQGLTSAVMLSFWQGVLSDLETSRCDRIAYLQSSDSPAIAKSRLLGFVENVSQGQMLPASWGRAVKSVFGLLVPNGLFEAMFDVNLLAMSAGWPCGCGCDSVAPSEGGEYGDFYNYALHPSPPISPHAVWFDNGVNYQTHHAVLDNNGHYSIYLGLGDMGEFLDTSFKVEAVFNGRIVEPQACSVAIDMVVDRPSDPHTWVCIDGQRCLLSSPMVGRMLAVTSSEPFSLKLSDRK